MWNKNIKIWLLKARLKMYSFAIHGNFFKVFFSTGGLHERNQWCKCKFFNKSKAPFNWKPIFMFDFNSFRAFKMLVSIRFLWNQRKKSILAKNWTLVKRGKTFGVQDKVVELLTMYCQQLNWFVDWKKSKK